MIDNLRELFRDEAFLLLQHNYFLEHTLKCLSRNGGWWVSAACYPGPDIPHSKDRTCGQHSALGLHRQPGSE